MRAELQDPPPAMRTSTKTKSEFLDKTYKFFLRKFDKPSKADDRERYTPPEYKPDGISPADVIWANAHRRRKWPSSLPESLEWLTDLCKFAQQYRCAWTLTSTGVVNDLVDAFNTREEGAWHNSEGMLLILLLNLCSRVKETQYKFSSSISSYIQLFSDLVQQPVMNQRAILRLNANYEFNGPAVDVLIPLLYACFTQNYIPQFVRSSDNSDPDKQISAMVGVTKVRVNLFDEQDITCYHKYRSHVEKKVDAYRELWKSSGNSHQDVDTALGDEIQYPPTVGNLLWNTAAEIFSTSGLITMQGAFSQKPGIFLRSALLKCLKSERPTPRAYLVAQQLVKDYVAASDLFYEFVPGIWDIFDRYLEADLQDKTDPNQAFTLTACFGAMLLMAMDNFQAPSRVVDKLQQFCIHPSTYQKESVAHLRIWQMITKIPSIELPKDIMEIRAQNAPRYIKLSYEILLRGTRKRSDDMLEADDFEPRSDGEFEMDYVDQQQWD